jgi:hypothetical protein
VSHAEHKSFDAVKERWLDAMSAAERAEFNDAYASERRKIESAEPSTGD